MVWDVKRKVWALRSFGRRHLRLGDSMAPILAVTKGRTAPRKRPAATPRPRPPPRSHLERPALEGARRADRCSARRRAHPAPAPVGPLAGTSFLEQRVIKPQQRMRYIAMVSEFKSWCLAMGIALGTVRELDVGLAQYFRDLFFNGEVVDRASALQAALAHLESYRLSRKTPELPRAWAALRGFGRLAPKRARLPMPWVVAALVIVKIVARGGVGAGLMTLLNFVFYCWLRHWGILLNPLEGEIPSKTHACDESLLNDNPDFKWVDAVLEHLRGRGPLAGPIADVDYAKWTAHFRAAVAELPLGPLLPATIYQMRRGGASREIHSGQRDLLGVKKRGRWDSDASLRRYVKAGRLNEQVHRLDQVTQFAANLCAERIGSVILQPSLARQLLAGAGPLECGLAVVSSLVGDPSLLD
ncbi:unnamed protein product [Prorocentrum cordatum]|uniref:Polynucleotide adenylyltransferase n=1 Tax=Prorocentrum cordatum TaxID=2364126 RepID=A0ABN9SY71_9DINO|nr:unnamed protein product [Polarella glacialis]